MSDNLRKFLRESCHYVVVNCNDMWAWACADSTDVETGEDLDALLAAEEKFGDEGVLAFLSLIESKDKPIHPQDALFSDSEYSQRYREGKGLSRERYHEARKWIAENTPPGEFSGEGPTLGEERHTARLAYLELEAACVANRSDLPPDVAHALDRILNRRAKDAKYKSGQADWVAKYMKDEGY